MSKPISLNNFDVFVLERLELFGPMSASKLGVSVSRTTLSIAGNLKRYRLLGLVDRNEKRLWRRTEKKVNLGALSSTA